MNQELFILSALALAALVSLGLGLGSLPLWAWLGSRRPRLYRVQGSLKRYYRLHNSGNRSEEYEVDAELQQLPGRRES